MLHNKVCLITGTSRGIGKAIAEKFAKENAIVLANARCQGSIDQWADDINSSSTGQIIPVYFDITNPNEIKQAIMFIKKNYGKVDVLVNNAGMATNERLGMISMEQTRKMFDVNVFGLIELTQIIATRFMMRQKEGSIINIASIVGTDGAKGQAAYAASKGAVISFTKSIAKELAEYNIRVNAVAPGLTDTDMLKAVSEEQLDKRIQLIPLKRVASTSDIANAVSFLASEQSNYITGQIIGVDGGAIM